MKATVERKSGSGAIGMVRAFSLALALACSANATAEEWTLNFNDTEIEQLIRFVADAAKLTVIIDPQVKGRVKVISEKPVSTEELYELFLSILEVHGYTAIRSGNVVRVVPQKDAKALPVPLVTEDQPARERSEIVTEVVQLQNINAAKLVPILRPLAPQEAHLAAYPPSNAIIVADTAANIARIRQIINRMDHSAVADADVIELRYAAAEEVVRIIESLFRAEAGEGEQKTTTIVADPRSNSILVTADQLQRDRIHTLVSRLDQPLEQVGDTRVRYLEYAKAKDIAEVLKRVSDARAKGSAASADKAGAQPVVIEADEATNSVIMSAEPGQLQTLDAVIDRLDIRRAQVLVEAIIVEIVADGLKDLGIQWLFKGEKTFGSFTGSPGALQGITEEIGTGDGGSLPVGDVARVLAATSGQVLGYADVDGTGTSIVSVINALQNNKQANILSTPSLLTLDNSAASITVGQEVPFLTGSFVQSGVSNAAGSPNPFQTIQRESVGTKLNVTPHVNEGDTIVLDIVQEVSSLTGLEASDIITNERKIESKIMIRDGDIVVLGGLIEDNVQQTVRKVPVLGSIPLLGKLFRNTSNQSTKTNLLVFMRPTIIRDPEVLEGATGIKYRQIRQTQLERRGAEGSDDAYRQAPLLPEWEEQLRAAEEIRARSRAIAEPGKPEAPDAPDAPEAPEAGDATETPTAPEP